MRQLCVPCLLPVSDPSIGCAASLLPVPVRRSRPWLRHEGPPATPLYQPTRDLLTASAANVPVSSYYASCKKVNIGRRDDLLTLLSIAVLCEARRRQQTVKGG